MKIILVLLLATAVFARELDAITGLPLPDPKKWGDKLSRVGPAGFLPGAGPKIRPVDPEVPDKMDESPITKEEINRFEKEMNGPDYRRRALERSQAFTLANNVVVKAASNPLQYPVQPALVAGLTKLPPSQTSGGVAARLRNLRKYKRLVRRNGRTGRGKIRRIPTRWSYSMRRRIGQQNWANLNREWLKCGTGRRQSPINIVNVVVDDRLPLVRGERAVASPVKLVNSGRGVMAAVLGRPTVGEAVFDYGGRILKIKEVRFHSPSEHAVRGTHFPLEAQIVTLDEARNMVILSVFFFEGRKSRVLAPFWEQFLAVKSAVKATTSLDPASFLPKKNAQYYSYVGSNPRPPCQEGVEWIVFAEAKALSPKQLHFFKIRANGATSRKIQPRNNRVVKISSKNPPLGIPYHSADKPLPRV